MIWNDFEFLSSKTFISWFSAELCKCLRCDLWELGGTKEPGEGWEQSMGEHGWRFAVSWHLLPRWKSSYSHAKISGNALNVQGQQSTSSPVTTVRVVGDSHCLLSLFFSSDKNKGNEGHEGRTKSLHRVHWLSICNRLWRSSSCIWRGPSGVKSHVPKQTEGFLCQSLCIPFLSLIISYPQPFTSSIF